MWMWRQLGDEDLTSIFFFICICRAITIRPIILHQVVRYDFITSAIVIFFAPLQDLGHMAHQTSELHTAADTFRTFHPRSSTSTFMS
jgi:hypothetical protein